MSIKKPSLEPDKPVTSRKIGARTACTLHFRCKIRAEIADLGHWTRENSSNILWIWQRFFPRIKVECDLFNCVGSISETIEIGTPK